MKKKLQDGTKKYITKKKKKFKMASGNKIQFDCLNNVPSKLPTVTLKTILTIFKKKMTEEADLKGLFIILA